MTKLVSLKLNEKFGVLQAQEAKFVENPDGLIEIRANVGSGKTTAKQAVEVAVSAGNTKLPAFDTEKFKNVDVEIELSTGIFMRTYSDKSGNLKSVAYRKLADGKLDKDPVIDGKKLTPPVLRDIIRTDLTFGIDDFLSENPRTHMDFMMKIYSHKLTELGVIFDKNSPKYQNSILWRLEQAKMDRENKHFARRAVNGFREALEKEGYDEENVPEITDLSLLETEKSEKINAVSKAIQDKIDVIKEDATKCITTIISYNDNLRQQDQIKAQERSTLNMNIDIVEKAQDILNFDNITFWLTENKKIAAKPIEPSVAVPMTDEGKPTGEAFNMPFSKNVNMALRDLITLRHKIAPLIRQQSEPVDTLEIDTKITTAKASNEIAARWNAFFDWQESDTNVKAIWKEYQNKFSEIDLGVPGLSIQIVGDEEKSSIRTHYNGSHNPDFFGNKKTEDRLLTQYSATQRPVIAILMQIYLLSQKKGGLKLIWIECPMDKKTRDLLIGVQKKYDITIVVGVTGDFTFDGLSQGQFLIENGELLCNLGK
jgi:hypothetical protein